MTQSFTAAAIAEAIHELELYASDVSGAGDVLDLVRALLDEQEDGANCT